jgi:low affinity Fe/Cu permease
VRVKYMKSASWFNRFAKRSAHAAGHPTTFVVAASVVIAWALTGPIFGFNQTWQLVINTSTTIVTFLMVFLIQNTQNRDTEAMQVKLDELIRTAKGAHTELLDLEELDEKQLQRIKDEYEELARKAQRKPETESGGHKASDSD